jgi:hypothetical protein
LKRGSLSQHEQNHNEIYDGKKPHLRISEEQYHLVQSKMQL